MVNHAILWYDRDVLGHGRTVVLPWYHGVLWICVFSCFRCFLSLYHGNPMVHHSTTAMCHHTVVSWYTMVCHGKLWDTMVNHGIS